MTVTELHGMTDGADAVLRVATTILRDAATHVARLTTGAPASDDVLDELEVLERRSTRNRRWIAARARSLDPEARAVLRQSASHLDRAVDELFASAELILVLGLGRPSPEVASVARCVVRATEAADAVIVQHAAREAAQARQRAAAAVGDDASLEQLAWQRVVSLLGSAVSNVERAVNRR